MIGSQVPSPQEPSGQQTRPRAYTNPNDDRFSKGFVWAALVIFTIGFLGMMYFLADYPLVSPSVEIPKPTVPQDQLWQLQAEVESLEQSKASSANEAFKAGLLEHEDLLKEIRDNVKQAEDDLAKSRETEQRTRGAAAIFLSVFGVVAALVLGQGYLQVKGWNDRAKEALDEIAKAMERIDGAMVQIEKAKPDLLQIQETRQSLENELPKYLNTLRDRLLIIEDPNAGMQKENLVLIDEIDHLTFLGNPLMRFQKKREYKESKDYMSSLLFAARGHLSRRNYHEAISRLDEFFREANAYPNVASPQEVAQGYSSRATASYQILRSMASDPEWLRESRAGIEKDLRGRAFADVRRSKEADPSWDQADWTEALLYSRTYVPLELKAADKEEVYLHGQRQAIRIYRELLTSKFRQKSIARQNLACCLKRLAEYTGTDQDFDEFREEVGNFPNDRDLAEEAIRDTAKRSKQFLWHAMMADSELFMRLKRIDLKAYIEFWYLVLDQKVILRSWRTDLIAIKNSIPGYDNWHVQL